MDYELKIINDEIVGVLEIEENSQFNKIEADKVIIAENTTARLFGKVKDVVLKKGSKLFFHGVISGVVENKGGEIFIYKK